MAVDMFLKIDGIEGESRDAKHAKEIDVLAWSWGMSQSASMHMGSGGGSGKVSVQDLSVTKYVDKSSPNLMLYCSNGSHIKSATLTVRKAGGDPVEYIKVTLEEVIVSSVATGGSGGEDRLTENVSFNFAKVKSEYQPQGADGKPLGGVITYGWNVAENIKWG